MCSWIMLLIKNTVWGNGNSVVSKLTEFEMCVKNFVHNFEVIKWLHPERSIKIELI